MEILNDFFSLKSVLAILKSIKNLWPKFRTVQNFGHEFSDISLTVCYISHKLSQLYHNL